MKSNSQTPGSPPLLINAAAQAAGRGSGLPSLLNGNRPILGGFITLALRVLRSGSPDKGNRWITGGIPEDNRTNSRESRGWFGPAGRVQPSTALCASHHG